jgi:hypothetical protein
MIALFACQKDDLTINDTYYKIYDTELSGKLYSLLTSDLGILILEAESGIITNSGEGVRVSFPNIIKLDRSGGLIWKLQSKNYFEPILLQENGAYYSLFTYIHRGEASVKDYIAKDTIAEVQIDKEKGTIIKNVLYLRNDFTLLPQKTLNNNRFLYFDPSQVSILSDNFRIINKKDWNLSGEIKYIDKNNQHFIFNQLSSNEENSLIMLAKQDLSSLTALCFSSLSAEFLNQEIGAITNVFPINEEEYIFVIYSNRGLQTSFYFTPAISIKAELESKALQEPVFQDINASWIGDSDDDSLLTEVRERYGNLYRVPLRSTDILEKARKSGEVYRTFNLDINDKETFIRKAKDRILIIKNSGGYEILLYEYLVKEKKYKLLKTLGRNIPYYLQDAEVNDNGDLFMIGNTQVAKDLNSLFVIKLPYEDIPR